LPEDAQRRINLWRKGIFLFHRTSEEEGTFHQAGYSDYWCEGKSIEGLTPDIFGFSSSYYCVCDLSISRSKGDSMQKYKDCEPSAFIKRVLSIEGDRKKTGDPFLITDQYGLRKYPGYNLIQVDTPVNIELDGIEDIGLERILKDWPGFKTVEPSFQLLAVPESSPLELKKPLAGILNWVIFQHANVGYGTIVNKLLGHLEKSFSQRSKAELREKVKKMLIDLSRSHLKDYIKIGADGFWIEIDISNYQARKGFTNKINEWLEIKPIEEFLVEDDFEDQ